MAPTLNDGDRALATRDVGVLERGDIVGFRYPRDESKSFVQRIVATPGDRIEMRDGRVTLNGALLDETYVLSGNRSADSWGPVTVPPDHYFVMGDNRRNSSDSRSWGTVRRDAIWAKVLDR
jgi:signal peptidase I